MSGVAMETTQLDSILDEIEEYLEDREDVVDGSYGEPAPNKEMRLLQELRAARRKALRAVSA